MLTSCPPPALLGLIEKAWRDGFDPQGMDLYLPRGVIGTERWIGATETWALLAGLGLRAKIVDFEEGHQSAGENVVAWLLNYFLEDSSTTQTVGGSGDATKDYNVAGFSFTSNPIIKGVNGDEPCVAWASAWRQGPAGSLPPVFLQQSGHSRTIAGVIRERNGDVSLVVLDPAKHLTMRNLDQSDWRNHVVVRAETLTRYKSYQLVHVLPGEVPASEVLSGANKDPNQHVYKR